MADYKGGTEYTAPQNSGLIPSTSFGYDVVASRLETAKRERARSRRNAQLHDGSQFCKFFCEEISLSLGMSGSTAQSRYVRDFYAHNIKIPALNVMGQSIDQDDYATVTEFVRQAQRKSVENSNLVKFTLNAGGSNVVQKNSNAIIKGAHKPINALGYIKTIKRKHERFVYAPKFTFEFIIVQMEDGILKSVLSEDAGEKNWTEILETLIEHKLEPEKEYVEASAKQAEGIGSSILEALKGGF